MATPKRRYTLEIDPRERTARLPELARACDSFDVRIRQLSVGDYLIDGRVVVERKSYADFSRSLIDGRLFPQAAALARSPHRPLILIEGPQPDRLPAVHPNALHGAIASLAVMWRLPLIEVPTPEDSLRLFRYLAEQAAPAEPGILKRYDRKPKRRGSRRLYFASGTSRRRTGTGRAPARQVRFHRASRAKHAHVVGTPRRCRCRRISSFTRSATGDASWKPLPGFVTPSNGRPDGSGRRCTASRHADEPPAPTGRMKAPTDDAVRTHHRIGRVRVAGIRREHPPAELQGLSVGAKRTRCVSLDREHVRRRGANVRRTVNSRIIGNGRQPLLSDTDVLDAANPRRDISAGRGLIAAARLH